METTEDRLSGMADITDPVKALREKADAAALLKYGTGLLTKDDVNYIAKTVLSFGCPKVDAERFRNFMQWLNETLGLLKIEEMKYSLG